MTHDEERTTKVNGHSCATFAAVRAVEGPGPGIAALPKFEKPVST